MGILCFSVFYMVLVLSVNIVFVDIEIVNGLCEGDMKKLVFYSDVCDISDVVFVMFEGDMMLDVFEGKYVLLNFWVIWCVLCCKEMLMLFEFQIELGDDEFEVVIIVIG